MRCPLNPQSQRSITVNFSGRHSPRVAVGVLTLAFLLLQTGWSEEITTVYDSPMLVADRSLLNLMPQSPNTVQVQVDAVKPIGKLDPFWASQIVHPTEFLLTDWGRDFIKLITESGAARQYIRIYNQPENAFRKDADGKISYDWSDFDKMATTILATGCKLNVVFFGMPSEIADHPESVRKRPYGATVCSSPPKDYKQWEEVCADFTRHVVAKYGLDEVKQWTFRCWNEPDGGFWYKGDLQAYLKLYDYFAKAVKGVCPEIKIGGPGLTSGGTYRKPENLRMFFEHVTAGTNHATGEVGAPIDYIAVHTYGGSSAGGGPNRQYPELDYMMEQQLLFADIRDEFPQLRKMPIHVEEWGETSNGTTGVAAKPTADIRNSQYGAAYLAAWVERHIRIRTENDRKIGGFTFCASGYEKIADHDFMGYRTLDTKSGFHKPILNGYKLLNKLDAELIAVRTEENKNITTFATRDKHRICVVVVNYQHVKPFNDGLTNLVSLQIKSHLGSGNVVLKHWRIDEKHSNAYTAFKEIGSPKQPDQTQIDAIKKRMDLELLEPPQRMESKDSFDLKFDLPCNAVSLIEIVKE